ncbi:MAG TPA: RHS repeat-associated core domain-containing protein, partial [Longimicrobium sp.]|nr:RHS repeat-associated core domain-containing protein [Longimicrobium sp.]
VQSWELHKFGRKRVCVDIRDCTMVDTDSLAQSLGFAWDAEGFPTGATRDPGNRVRAYGGYSYDYDADGNLTRKYSASGFSQTFTWNALGQLATTSVAGVGGVGYQYDGLGRRVSREDHTGNMIHYVYDGDDLVLEVDGAGNRIREYTYFPGIDRPHSMRQWAGGGGGAIYYYQMQRPGHVSGLVNTSNQLVNEYRYTPFGTPVNGYPVQGTPNPLQYMARELDALSGLYYVRNRWYDPQQGRFVSEDPIGLAGGVNQYAYVGNDPLGATDPTGLCAYSTQLPSGQIVTMRMPPMVWGNAGGGPVQMYLQCSSVDWVWIAKWNAMLVSDYNTGWAAMYGRSTIGPRSGASGRGSTPEAPSNPSWLTPQCGTAVALAILQGGADWLFFTGVGTAASLALRGTISASLGRGLAGTSARMGVANGLFMPASAMAPGMIEAGMISKAGALGAATDAVVTWTLSPAGTPVEAALMQQAAGIGEFGIADMIPGVATYDAVTTAIGVCRGS